MSLSYSDCNILGGPLDPGVLKQLELRKNVVSKVTTRTPADIAYLNSNTGWVKVTSSVDRVNNKLISYTGNLSMTIEDGNVTKRSTTEVTTYQVNKDSSNAKKFKLEGGTSQGQSGFQPSAAYNFGDENSSYKTSESGEYGFIPTPGITNFNVSTQNLYGTLRVASFNLVVHSPEDFSIIEELYMRPGMSILLEWGHSLHLKNDSQNIFEPDLETNIQTFGNEFFSKMPQEDIEKRIKEYKGASTVGNSYNYDAMFGFIRNFSWSYNGVNYICQVDVVSKGEILQSIKSTFAPLSEKTTKFDDTQYNPTNYASEVERFLNGVLSGPAPHTGNTPYSADSSGTLEYLETESPELLKTILARHDELKYKFEIIAGAQGTSGRRSRGKTWNKYITLRSLLILFNEVSLIYDDNKKPLVKFHTGEGKCSRFTTFLEHIGLDPSICMLPKPANVESSTDLFYKLSTVVPFDYSNYTDVLNIFVSVEVVLNIIKERKNLKSDQDNTLYDVVKDLLNEIESNIGYINEFDIHFDEDESQFYIVDRSVVPTNVNTLIDLVGLNSEVENLSIVSKLSSNLTSAIAISAQAGYSPSAGVDLYNMQKWHEGLGDRHYPKKIAGKSFFKSDPKQTATKKLKDTLISYVQKTNGSKDTNSTYDPDSAGLIDIHRQVMNEFVREYSETGNINPPGLIPFELSFTTKGISGLKIGQSFTIPDFFLPTRYKNKVAFLVTGIDHKVENSRWTTDIKTQMFIRNGTPQN